MGSPGSITPLLTPMRLHRGGEQDQDGKSTDLPFANHYIKVYSVNTPHELPAELPGVAMDVLRDNTQRAAGLLKSLANPDRLLLLCQLSQGECCVSELEESLGIRQPTLSQQLGVLRNEEVVSTRREGKNIYYQIASPQALAVMNVLFEQFCGPAQGPAEEDQKC